MEWSKNNKEPVGAFASMHNGARVAMKGLTPLSAGDRADLVIKIIYDSTLDSIDLSVTDSESGDTVFIEVRTVSDLFSVHDDDVRLHSTLGGLSHRAVP